MTHADKVLRPVISDKVNCLNARMGTGSNQIPIIVGALCARDCKGGGNQYVAEGKLQVRNGQIRRLTPVECERLQGLLNPVSTLS